MQRVFSVSYTFYFITTCFGCIRSSGIYSPAKIILLYVLFCLYAYVLHLVVYVNYYVFLVRLLYQHTRLMMIM
jgi:hypothetical protein